MNFSIELNWITITLISFALFTELWVYYLAIMNLKRKREEDKKRISNGEKGVEGIPKLTYIMILPILIVGVLLDFIINMLISIPLLDIPREFLVTHRMERLMSRDDFRGNVSRWMCKNMLNPFDPSGEHCSKKRR